MDGAVGSAIRRSQIPRSQIFVTTKFWPHFSGPEHVGVCLDLVLEGMGLEYVDLYLAHWPVATVADQARVRAARAGPDVGPEELGVVVDEGTGRERVDSGRCPRDVAGRLGLFCFSLVLFLLFWFWFWGPAWYCSAVLSLRVLGWMDLFVARSRERGADADVGAEGSFLPTWRAMQALVESGKCRAIGVSNSSITQLDEILSSYPQSSTTSNSSSASESTATATATKTNPNIPLSCNQIEAHPYLPNAPLLDYMRKHSILASAYSPFAGQAAFPSPWLTKPSDPQPLLLEHPTVKSLAQKNKMGVGQLLQSWAVQRGTIPLGKSQDEARIKANLNVRRLSEEDMRALDELEVPDEAGRTIDYGPYWGVKFFV